MISCWHLWSCSQKEQGPDPQPVYGFKDPDPYQNVTDPENWLLLFSVCFCWLKRVFPPVLRKRNKSFGSGVGSGSGLKLVSDSDRDSNSDPNLDSNPDSNPGLESGSWIRISCGSGSNSWCGSGSGSSSGGGGGVGQPKLCIPPGKILGTPLVRTYAFFVTFFLF